MTSRGCPFCGTTFGDDHAARQHVVHCPTLLQIIFLQLVHNISEGWLLVPNQTDLPGKPLKDLIQQARTAKMPDGGMCEYLNQHCAFCGAQVSSDAIKTHLRQKHAPIWKAKDQALTLCKNYTKSVGNPCTFCKSAIKNSRYKEHTVLCPPLIQWTLLSLQAPPPGDSTQAEGHARLNAADSAGQGRSPGPMQHSGPSQEEPTLRHGQPTSGGRGDLVKLRGRSSAGPQHSLPCTQPESSRTASLAASQSSGCPAQARAPNAASALPDGPVARGGDLGRAPAVIQQQSADPHPSPTGHQAGRRVGPFSWDCGRS